MMCFGKYIGSTMRVPPLPFVPVGAALSLPCSQLALRSLARTKTYKESRSHPRFCCRGQHSAMLFSWAHSQLHGGVQKWLGVDGTRGTEKLQTGAWLRLVGSKARADARVPPGAAHLHPKTTLGWRNRKNCPGGEVLWLQLAGHQHGPGGN